MYKANFQIQAMTAVFDLKGHPDDILHRFEPASLVYRVAPQHWLVRTTLDQEARLFAHLTKAPCASDTLIINVSDAYTFIGIDGPDADQMIAIASPIDAWAMPVGAAGATFTEVFGQKAFLIRQPKGFEIAVERSYSQLLLDFFSRVNGSAT
jgi:heterotetrameric sarcosine oxidase gamma subunit